MGASRKNTVMGLNWRVWRGRGGVFLGAYRRYLRCNSSDYKMGRRELISSVHNLGTKCLHARHDIPMIPLTVNTTTIRLSLAEHNPSRLHYMLQFQRLCYDKYFSTVSAPLSPRMIS